MTKYNNNNSRTKQFLGQRSVKWQVDQLLIQKSLKILICLEQIMIRNEMLYNANIFVGYKFHGFVKILIVRKINSRIASII